MIKEGFKPYFIIKDKFGMIHLMRINRECGSKLFPEIYKSILTFFNFLSYSKEIDNFSTH